MALSAVAQDFKLYYAKDVTNVTDFSSTRKIAQQLTWKEVKNGAIDGNAADVKAVTDMLKDPRMKGLDDQRLFWRMRDETLLAFRINDGSGKTGIYEVEVAYGVKTDEGNPYKQMLNTSSYFFANMPLFSSESNITVTVKKKGSKDKPFVFRYWVYDWDNENVYIFPSFASALALFQAFLYTENVFLFLFPKRSGFLFSSHFADISDCKS